MRGREKARQLATLKLPADSIVDFTNERDDVVFEGGIFGKGDKSRMKNICFGTIQPVQPKFARKLKISREL